MTEAAVYIGRINRADIIREYYERCGLETIGPTARVPVREIQSFTSFEDLVDKMLKRSEWVQVIVCHGTPEQGLLIPLAQGGSHTATGNVMKDLAALAQENRCLRPEHPAYAGRFQFVADGMGVKKETVARVAEKLGMLHSRGFIVEIRGCRVGKDPDMLDGYRKAFGHMTSAPTCRMFYLRIEPGRPPRGRTMDDLKSAQPARPQSRRRFFSDPSLGTAGPIIIDITDVDGHTNVQPAAFMNDPHHATDWANRLLTIWRQAPTGAGNNRFVLPVMWDDLESTFHLPLEPGYSSKLRMIA